MEDYAQYIFKKYPPESEKIEPLPLRYKIFIVWELSMITIISYSILAMWLNLHKDISFGLVPLLAFLGLLLPWFFMTPIEEYQKIISCERGGDNG